MKKQEQSHKLSLMKIILFSKIKLDYILLRKKETIKLFRENKLSRGYM